MGRRVATPLMPWPSPQQTQEPGPRLYPKGSETWPFAFSRTARSPGHRAPDCPARSVSAAGTRPRRMHRGGGRAGALRGDRTHRGGVVGKARQVPPSLKLWVQVPSSSPGPLRTRSPFSSLRGGPRSRTPGSQGGTLTATPIIPEPHWPASVCVPGRDGRAGGDPHRCGPGEGSDVETEGTSRVERERSLHSCGVSPSPCPGKRRGRRDPRPAASAQGSRLPASAQPARTQTRASSPAPPRGRPRARAGGEGCAPHAPHAPLAPQRRRAAPPGCPRAAGLCAPPPAAAARDPAGSPDGHPALGVVQPLQAAEEVRQSVRGVAGQHGHQHGGSLQG